MFALETAPVPFLRKNILRADHRLAGLSRSPAPPSANISSALSHARAIVLAMPLPTSAAASQAQSIAQAKYGHVPLRSQSWLQAKYSTYDGLGRLQRGQPTPSWLRHCRQDTSKLPPPTRRSTFAHQSYAQPSSRKHLAALSDYRLKTPPGLGLRCGMLYTIRVDKNRPRLTPTATWMTPRRTVKAGPAVALDADAALARPELI